MLTIARTASGLEPDIEAALAVYRHRVFIDDLGWTLPHAKNGMERDQFDRSDVVYVIAKDEDGMICGCARLLPTTKPYLLEESFPEFLDAQRAPHSPDVWELSRFSTKIPGCADFLSREEARHRFRTLFAAVVKSSLEQHASRLITLSAMGVERILRSFGVHVHRVGPPKLIGGDPLLAMWIELDGQTRRALDLDMDRAPAVSH